MFIMHVLCIHIHTHQMPRDIFNISGKNTFIPLTRKVHTMFFFVCLKDKKNPITEDLNVLPQRGYRLHIKPHNL